MVAVGDHLNTVINAVMAPITDGLGAFIFYKIPIAGAEVQWIALWLVAASLFFTVYLRFINVRGLSHALALVRGKSSAPKAAGEISAFKALATALSSIVGLGHIAGIAVAISTGGPGAAFWLIVMGLISMSTKFAEAFLGVKYRITVADGSLSGGPTYYLARGFADRGYPALGKFMAGFAAIALVIAANGFFQINQAEKQFAFATGIVQPVLFGVVAMLVVGVVVIGELKSIAAVVSRLVPFMCIIYLLAGFIILVVHASALPHALYIIVAEAFSPHAVKGGFIGCLVIGVRRAAFANEAGLGVTASAHASAKTNSPVAQGFVAMLEPLVSVVLICATTALIVIVTGAYQSHSAEGIEITSLAYASVFPWFTNILTLAVMLFAYSTIIGCFYYGLKAWTYMFGDVWWVKLIFKLIYIAQLLVGSVMPLEKIIDLSDAAQFIVGIPNIIGLYLFAGEIKRDLSVYWDGLKNIRHSSEGS